MKRLFSLLSILALLLQPAIASTRHASRTGQAAVASIYYVDADVSGANNGSSWEDAFTSLQDALQAAVDGDQIWVAAGSYTPGVVGNRLGTFQLPNGAALYGGFDPSRGDIAWEDRDWESNPAILSGDLDHNGVLDDGNAYHVVTGSGLGEATILDGFTLTSGNANGIPPHDRGGGMYNIASSSPTLKNVIFSGNTAYIGGGMLNTDSSSPTLTNVSFSGNAADYGGGMYNWRASNPSLTNVSFSGNTASSGGGMCNNTSSSPTLTNVSFSGNTATYAGGGMYNIAWSSPSLTNVSFSGNTAGSGGAIYSDGSYLSLTNVTFSGNTATYAGGGIYNINSSQRPTLTNAILWGNTPDQIYYNGNINDLPVVTYSDIQGGYSGTDIIDLDPQFIRSPSPGVDGAWGTADDDYGDLRLQPTSPAIDAGDNTALPAGITTDLSGASRFVDIPTIPDQGVGPPPVVDLGAYEVQAPTKGEFNIHLPLILK